MEVCEGEPCAVRFELEDQHELMIFLKIYTSKLFC